MKRLLVLCLCIILLSSCTTEVVLREFHPSDLKGEKNLLFIWQPECKFCETELKELETMYKDFDLNIVGIAVNDLPEAVQKKIDAWGLTFPNYLASQEFFTQIASMVTETPAIIFMDEEGNIFRAPEEGTTENLRALLEEVEKE